MQKRVPDVVKNLNVKVLMKQDTQNGTKRVNVIVNLGLMVEKDLFGILEIVSVNVIKRVILVNTQTTKIVSVEKNQLINQLMNILKLLNK